MNLDDDMVDFKTVCEKLNEFTTLLNKHGLEYSVVWWKSGEGLSIKLKNNISIDFYISGLVEFVHGEEDND